MSDFKVKRTVDCMEKTVKLLMNHYIGDEFYPSRQVIFMITEKCLQDYMTETDDDRTVEMFFGNIRQ